MILNDNRVNSYLQTNKRRDNNFDFLRLFLALLVSIYHLAILTKTNALFTYLPYNIAEFAVDSFFIISGYLIFISFYSSKSLSQYFSKRSRRILPAYISVILISSTLLYFITEDVNFFNYFNIDYLKYIFSNLLTLNFLYPTIPNVFQHNMTPTINGALWTIKIEIMFYITVPILIYIINKFNTIITLILIYILSILYSYFMMYQYSTTGLDIYLTLEKQLPGQLAFFISGASLYYYNSLFHKYKTLLFVFSISILYLHFNVTPLYLFYPLTLAMFILYIATIIPYLGNFSKYGDLSFGIYIWHFPIIQTLISLNLFENLIFGISLFMILTFIAALFSWHLIEKRFFKKV